MSPSQLLKSGLSTLRNQKDRLMLFRDPCRHAASVLRYRTRLLIDKYIHPNSRSHMSEEDKLVDDFVKQYEYLGTSRDSFDQCFKNRTGHRTVRVLVHWFIGRTTGSLVEPHE
ncbi:hypothetical protein QL285_012176 [Trifolium repens]|nr:hypothetical protein QL285_012176 [Trifolium repens]